MSDDRYDVRVADDDFGRAVHISVHDTAANIYIVGQYDVITPYGSATPKTVPFMSFSPALLDAAELFRAVADALDAYNNRKALQSNPLELDPEDVRDR